jgi:hypothetical protein
MFLWDTAGSPSGTYLWNALANSGDFAAIGRLTINLVPEPATVKLIGLAAIGLAGFLRHNRQLTTFCPGPREYCRNWWQASLQP